MSQRTMGAFALLGGAFLAGSLMANASGRPEEGAPLRPRQPGTGSPAVSIPSASSVPGATEPAQCTAAAGQRCGRGPDLEGA